MDRWVISDTHFSHANSWLKFKNPDGSPLRPFTSNEEMDNTMVERWNEVVKPQDHVYHLGDVAIAKRGLENLKRLNGHIRLIRGNHDIFKDQVYRDAGVEQIHGVRVFVDKFILSHIPLHPNCVTHRFRVNVHGHLHNNQVTLDGTNEPDVRYLCVCVEQVDYRPVNFDEVEVMIKKRWDEAGYEGPTGYFNGSCPS